MNINIQFVQGSSEIILNILKRRGKKPGFITLVIVSTNWIIPLKLAQSAFGDKKKIYFFTLYCRKSGKKDRKQLQCIHPHKTNNHEHPSKPINQASTPSFRRAVIHSLRTSQMLHQELACALSVALSGGSSASCPCLACWDSEVVSLPYLMSMLLENV